MHADGLNETGVNVGTAPRRFHEFCGTSYFRALDGLRALAIILVVAHHSQRFDIPILRTLQENGRHGVSLFFVISGFLISTLLLREQQKWGVISLGAFYRKRAARLLPLYYAVLALHMVVVFAFDVFTPQGEQLFRDKLPSYLFYYSNWLPTATEGPFFYAWSLAVEEQFYLCFGLLLFLFPRRAVVALAAGALALKFAIFQSIGAVDVHSTVWRIVFSYQEPILLGVLLGFALNCRAIHERAARWLHSRALATSTWVLLAGWLVLHPIQTQSTWDAQVLFALMTLAVAFCAVRPSTRWLEGPVLTQIGKVSYGIYLMHWLVLVGVYRVVPGLSAFPGVDVLITMVVVVVLASVVYRYLESPIIACAKRSASRRVLDPLASLATRAVPVAPPAIIRPVPPV